MNAILLPRPSARCRSMNCVEALVEVIGQKSWLKGNSSLLPWTGYRFGRTTFGVVVMELLSAHLQRDVVAERIEYVALLGPFGQQPVQRRLGKSKQARPERIE